MGRFGNGKNKAMSSKFSILFILASLCCFACNEEITNLYPCNSQNLGTYLIEEESWDFLPSEYRDSIPIFFENAEGDECVFSFSGKGSDLVETSLLKSCLGTTDVGVYTFTIEQSGVRFSGQIDSIPYDMEFNLEVVGQPLLSEGLDTAFIDIIGFWIKDAINLSFNRFTSYYTSCRESADPEIIEQFCQDPLIEEFTIQNRSFNEVLIGRDTAIVVARGQGIIAFRDKNDILWVKK